MIKINKVKLNKKILKIILPKIPLKINEILKFKIIFNSINFQNLFLFYFSN